MQRNVTPDEMVAIAQLAAENPDLRQVVVELGQLRALRAATSGQAPLRPVSFRELLKGVEAGLLSLPEARSYMGLPPRRGTLERVIDWMLRPLPLVVSELAHRRSLSRSGG